jgi:hypothetical protein
VRMLLARSCGMASANERVGEQQLDGSSKKRSLLTCRWSNHDQLKNR